MARSDKTGAYGKSEQFTESLRRTAEDVSSNLSQAADGLKEKVTDAGEQVKVGVEEIGSTPIPIKAAEIGLSRTAS